MRYKAAALMAFPGLIVSPASLWLSQRVPNEPLMLFALMLVNVAIRMLSQSRVSPRDDSPET